MPASAALAELQDLLRRHGLGSALPGTPRPEPPPAPTGFQELDDRLGGGLPRGRISEIAGPLSSGRTALLMSLLAGATRRGEAAAYIDRLDSLDPPSAQRAGVVLERLLWVRCGPRTSGGDGSGAPPRWRPGRRGLRRPAPAGQAWQAANLIASAGGFGVVALDLGGIPVREQSDWQARPWFRLQRMIEHTATVFVVLAPRRLAAAASARALRLSRKQTHWQRRPGVSLLLEGASVSVEL